MDRSIYEREAERFREATVEELFLSCLDDIWDVRKMKVMHLPESARAAGMVRYERLLDAGYPDGLWFMAGLLVRPLTREERKAEIERYMEESCQK